MSNFRLWLAGRIAPELVRDSIRYYRLRAVLENEKHWLGEFPIVRVVLDHFTIGHWNWKRALDEKPLVHRTEHGAWSDEISAFREELRMRFPAARRVNQGQQPEPETTTS